MPVNWVEKILDFAVINEEHAAAFYRKLAGAAHRDDARQLFLDIAREEDQHKARLLSIKAGERGLLSETEIVNQGLVDRLRDKPLDPAGEIDHAEALVIAIKAEQEAYDLYSSLAETTADAACKEVLRGLAREEAEHKATFEREYEEYIRAAQ